MYIGVRVWVYRCECIHRYTSCIVIRLLTHLLKKQFSTFDISLLIYNINNLSTQYYIYVPIT